MCNIFVGGMGGSGTRVVQYLMERAGYFCGCQLNDFMDWMGPDNNFISCFDTALFKNNWQPLKDIIDDNINRYRFLPYSLKHGHFMFIIPELHKWYPESKYIHVVRHPVDNILNEYNMHVKYGNYKPYAGLKNKLDFYEKVNSEALDHADYVIRLEDLIFDSENTIRKLMAFTDVKEYDIMSMKSIIIVPKTIGRGKKYYSLFEKKYSIITRLGYGKENKYV